MSDHSLRGPWRCWQHSPVITFLYHPLALLSLCFQLSVSVSNSNQVVSTRQASLSGLHPGKALVFIFSASFKTLNSFLSQSHCSLVRTGFMLVSLCLSFSHLHSIFLSNVLPLSGFLFLTRTHTHTHAGRQAWNASAYISHGICNTFCFTRSSNVLEHGTCCAQLI